ncbi:hypothetical protein EVAR_101373_1 [Eumeta japonica]|uniref:Integrase zinc-binding domain-containing protein n=1 Tax=Eumeta variegata TaxID=151549 RepID=A0A4C1TTA4_EUMVA|nr:hypothetical protein EVAR_101373_1 [Eumeta japonica]
MPRSCTQSRKTGYRLFLMRPELSQKRPGKSCDTALSRIQVDEMMQQTHSRIDSRPKSLKKIEYWRNDTHENKIRLHYYWKGMTRDIARYVKRCKACQTNKIVVNGKERGIITPTPLKAFDRAGHKSDMVHKGPYKSNIKMLDNHGKTSVDVHELMLKFYKEGKSLRETGAIIGRSHNTVKYIITAKRLHLENRRNLEESSGISVSASTIRRTLHAKWSCMDEFKEKPYISPTDAGVESLPKIRKSV